MLYRTLGRTGWRVSLLGLGTGGVSQLGQRYELPYEQSARLVRHALDRGLNMIDTAPSYGDSEERVGFALQDIPRESYFLSTKFQPRAEGTTLYPPQDLRASLERSLRNLKTDYVDIFYIHGVGPDLYEAIEQQLMPELRKAKDAGLIRAIGGSELYQVDHSHSVAQRAIADGTYDVLMVGMNLMSPDAFTSVLPPAQEHNVGIVIMCAVRTVLIDPVQIKRYVDRWEAEGLLPAGSIDPEHAFDDLLDAETPSVPAAAYKFAAEHPAVGTVLTGTASIEHFDDNLKAILGPPLSEANKQRVMATYGPVQRNVQPERIRMTRR